LLDFVIEARNKEYFLKYSVDGFLDSYDLLPETALILPLLSNKN